MHDDPIAVSGEDVAYRALAMMTACFRASAEQILRAGPNAPWEESLEEVRGWAREVGVDAHFSDVERELMETPVGELDDRQLFEQGWRLQGGVALLWSLEKFDAMPTYAASVPASVVQALIPLTKPIDKFLDSAKLRPRPEIEAERTRAQFWNWRSRCEIFRRQGQRPPDGQTYEATIRSAAQSAFNNGIVEELAEGGGDVAFEGIPYAQLDPQVFAHAASTAFERHHAFNWILGDSDDWDSVSTDT